MDWSKTKSLFIVIFLVLDLFLLFQLYQKKVSTDLDYLTETQVEGRLPIKDEEIKKLPSEEIKLSYISCKSRKFSRSDLNKLENQTVNIVSDNQIVSNLKAPYFIDSRNQEISLENFLGSYIYEGAKYEYWGKETRTNTLVFYQKYNNKVIYENESGKLVLQLNKDGDIVSYTQTMLDDITEMNKNEGKQVLLTATKALEVINRKYELKDNTKISDVKLGYYTLIPLSTGTQVLAPTWYFRINDAQYFVNAIEGHLVVNQDIQWSE